MAFIQESKLKRNMAKRVTLWVSHEHKDYLEDLAYSSRSTQTDVLNYIIEHYRSSHPLIPIKEPVNE